VKANHKSKYCSPNGRVADRRSATWIEGDRALRKRRQELSSLVKCAVVLDPGRAYARRDRQYVALNGATDFQGG